MGPSAIVLFGCTAVFLALFVTTIVYLLVLLNRHYQQKTTEISKALPLYEASTPEMRHARLRYKLAEAE